MVNGEFISATASLLKCRSAVVEENVFEMEQLFWLKIEAMHEDWVKFLEGFHMKDFAGFCFSLI